MYQIDIKDLRLYGYHGVFPEEKTLGQEFAIDLQCQIDLDPFLLDDDPRRILSYVDIVNQIKTTFCKEKFNLIEHLSALILTDLAIFPQIKFAKIRLKKIHPPIEETLSYLSVELEKDYRENQPDTIV